MAIVTLDRDIEFEKDLLDLLIEYGYIPEEKRDKIKKADLNVYGDQPMTLEVWNDD